MSTLKDKPLFKTIFLILLDVLILAAVDGLTLLIRFEFSIERISHEYFAACVRYFPLRCALTVLVFYATRMYHYIWRHVNLHDIAQMILSVVLAWLVCLAARTIAGQDMPRSYYAISLFLQIIVFVCERSFPRFVHVLRYELSSRKNAERIMLIGAGRAGEMLLREISAGKIYGRVVCIVDDNASKHGKFLDGVRIVGGREKILAAVEDYHVTQIIFAIPTATPEQKRAIMDVCKMSGCRLRTLPGLYQLVNGEVTVDSVKDVHMEDLLGRETVKLGLDLLRPFLGGRTVMVTGGGGSIGSELCRQIAKYSPRTLVILDIYENNAYDIQQELIGLYGKSLDLRVEIASVRDRAKIDELFAFYRPDVVFHAAAHKHVPLMEDCPSEAIKNNIFGTYNVVCAAEKYEVKKFILISSDKAVNPTNVMGATKRFCEMILQSRHNSATKFCAVRFGNVLGSNGSVVPLFMKQLEKGGPLTLTDKRVIRYFMTISEAVQLVLEAGSMAERGQIYVLDMGEPVRILTLAENLIRLNGLEPYKDIDIVEIGLRPGEKLFEEILMSSETLSETQNKKIFVEQQQDIDRGTIEQQLAGFSEVVERSGSHDEYVDLLRSYVPTYRDPEEVNARVRASLEADETEKQAVN